MVTTPWTWKERSENPVKKSSKWHAIFPVHVTLVLRQSSCHEVLVVTSLLRQYRCYYVFLKTTRRSDPTTSSLRKFEHAQCSSTSSASMETISLPDRFSTAFPRRCASPYCVLLFFCGRGRSVAWCDGGKKINSMVIHSPKHGE